MKPVAAIHTRPSGVTRGSEPLSLRPRRCAKTRFGSDQFVFQPGQQFAQLVDRSLISFCEFKEHARVGNFRLKFFLSLERSLHATSLLQKFLRSLLIRPEVWCGSLRLDLL